MPMLPLSPQSSPGVEGFYRNEEDIGPALPELGDSTVGARKVANDLSPALYEKCLLDGEIWAQL